MQAIEEYCVFIRDSLANKEAILMHTMYQGFPPPGFTLESTFCLVGLALCFGTPWVQFAFSKQTYSFYFVC